MSNCCRHFFGNVFPVIFTFSAAILCFVGLVVPWQVENHGVYSYDPNGQLFAKGAERVPLTFSAISSVMVESLNPTADSVEFKPLLGNSLGDYIDQYSNRFSFHSWENGICFFREDEYAPFNYADMNIFDCPAASYGNSTYNWVHEEGVEYDVDYTALGEAFTSNFVFVALACACISLMLVLSFIRLCTTTKNFFNYAFYFFSLLGMAFGFVALFWFAYKVPALTKEAYDNSSMLNCDDGGFGICYDILDSYRVYYTGVINGRMMYLYRLSVIVPVGYIIFGCGIAASWVAFLFSWCKPSSPTQAPLNDPNYHVLLDDRHQQNVNSGQAYPYQAHNQANQQNQNYGYRQGNNYV